MMWIVINDESGEVYGPFDTRDAANVWVYEIVPRCEDRDNWTVKPVTKPFLPAMYRQEVKS